MLFNINVKKYIDIYDDPQLKGQKLVDGRYNLPEFKEDLSYLKVIQDRNAFNKNLINFTSVKCNWEKLDCYQLKEKLFSLIDASGMDIYGASDGSVNLAHFGYASGNAESGTSTQPYYTLGQRKSGSDIGIWSIAEGYNTTASAPGSHAEGSQTVAEGMYSHAEGRKTTASNSESHAEGYNTTASGTFSHAQNEGTIAASYAQTALGKYNKSDTADAYAVIIGNGTSDSSRWCCCAGASIC